MHAANDVTQLYDSILVHGGGSSIKPLALSHMHGWTRRKTLLPLLAQHGTGGDRGGGRGLAGAAPTR